MHYQPPVPAAAAVAAGIPKLPFWRTESTRLRFVPFSLGIEFLLLSQD